MKTEKIIKSCWEKIARDFLKNVDKYPFNFKELLNRARQKIIINLQDKGLIKVVFNDVSAEGIQISGIHKNATSYYFLRFTVFYDLSNLDEVVKNFIIKWEEIDNKNFIK